VALLQTNKKFVLTPFGSCQVGTDFPQRRCDDEHFQIVSLIRLSTLSNRLLARIFPCCTIWWALKMLDGNIKRAILDKTYSTTFWGLPVTTICKISNRGSRIPDTSLGFTSRCPLKTQISKRLGPFLHIELLKTSLAPNPRNIPWRGGKFRSVQGDPLCAR